MKPKEVWRNIPGHDGYQASSYGRIRSLNKIRSNGSPLKGRILKGTLNHNGYLRHQITAYSSIPTHRLILLAFKKQIPGKKFGNHKDFDRLNNRPSNLAWCTQKENNLHSIKYGRWSPVDRLPKMQGMNHHQAKLTEDAVRTIRSNVSEW